MIDGIDYEKTGHAIIKHGANCPHQSVDIFTHPNAKAMDNKASMDEGKIGDLNLDDMMADINKQQMNMPGMEAMEENLKTMFKDEMDADEEHQ